MQNLFRFPVAKLARNQSSAMPLFSRIMRPNNANLLNRRVQLLSSLQQQRVPEKKSSFKEQFDRDGFFVIRGGLSVEETKLLQLWCSEIENRAIEQKQQTTNEDTVDGFHHFEKLPNGEIRICRSEDILHHKGISDLLCDGKLEDFASDCFGEKAVLYKEKINYKYPGGGHFKAHQDAPAWPLCDTHVTCAVCVDKVELNSGGVELARERHNDGVIGMNEDGVICDDVLQKEGLPKIEYETIEAEAGDILCFDSYTPHRSGENCSENTRRILYATFNKQSDGEHRTGYYAAKRNDLKDGKISFIFDFQGNVVDKIGN